MRETIDVVSGPQTSTRNGERFRSAGSGNRTLLAVIALIAIGAALRLYRLDAQSVWYDEAYSIMLARESVGTISTQVIGDHLPLYFVMLHYWAALAGQTEFAVRYLSLLFDLATIAAIYALGKRLVGTAEGSVAGGLAAFSPFLVYYSQETRMYTFLVFLATSSTYVLHRATRDEPRLWLAYGLLATAMAYTHYYSLPFLAGQAVLACLLIVQDSRRRKPRERRRRLAWWALAELAVAGAFLPWMMTRADVFDGYLSIAAGQFSVVSMLWRCLIGFSLGHPMESLNPTVAGPSFADNHAYALWIGAGFAALTLVGFAGAIGDRLRRSSSSRSENRSNHRSDFALVVSCLLAVTASGVVLASIGRRDVWSRYLSPITPIYYLLLVYGLFELRRMSRIVFVASTALVALAFGLALNWYYTDVQFARDDFRGVAQFIAANGTGDDAVVCGSSYWTVAVDYYRPGAKPCEPAIDEYPLDEAATAARLRRITGANRFVWLVLWQDYFSDPTGYVERWLGTEGLLVIDKPLHGLRVKGYYTRAPLVDERDVPNRGTWRIGDQVQLLGYDVSPAVAGATSKVTLYWRTSAPIGEDYTTYVHLVSTPYQVWAQQDSPPLRGSYGTSKWQTGDILRDEYDLAIPAFTPPGDYQLEIGLYSAKTGQRIGGSGSDRANLGPVHVEATPAGTGLPISVRRDPVHFADVASLVAVSGEGRAKPGSDFRFELYWQDDQPAKASYTTFVHVVDSAGRIIAQGDAPPTLGVYPTSRWRAGEVVRDPREIHIPVEVPSGRYDVLVGLYDAASGSRLAVRPVESSDSGPLVWLRPAPTPQPTGDTTKVMSLIVE